MLNAVIAMASDDLNDIYRQALAGKFSVICCQDGETALSLLESIHPEILMIDLSLPLLDGFAVLEKAHNFLPPVILATTDLDNNYIRESAQAKGIGYLIQRPAHINMVIARLLDMVDQYRNGSSKQEAQRQIIAKLLLRMGFQPNLDGFSQLQIAIPLYAGDAGQRVCKEIYPVVAKILGVNGKNNVEHSIRTSIQKAWENRDENVWAAFFPVKADGTTKCPSNKVFISRLAEVLKQDM